MAGSDFDAVVWARELEAGLAAEGRQERAVGAKAYLKSELDFLGVDTPTLRRACKALLRQASDLDRDDWLELTAALWSRPVFELRAAAGEILTAKVEVLEAEDLARLETWLRDCQTWALVDLLAPRVVGPLVTRCRGEHPEVLARLDRWAEDGDFWIRRSALLFDLLALRRGEGDWERFGRYADALLDDREFFVRKAIGWVLREVSKQRPERVSTWLLAAASTKGAERRSIPRASRASGVTMREAVKYLPAAERKAVLALRESGSDRAGGDGGPAR